MKALAIVFHPGLAQSRVIRVWADALEASGIEVRRHTGEPLDHAAERAACEAADRLLFVHPFHWYSAPWPLKQWIDEVLTGDWAYGGPDRLAGKQWQHAISVGAGADEYVPGGSRRHSVEEFLRSFERTAAFCRAEYQSPFLFYGAGYRSEEDIHAAADALVKAMT